MMTSEIKIVKRNILQMEKLESSSKVDWESVNRLADEALSVIADAQIGNVIDPYSIKYLDDVEIREADSDYGAYQRKKILEIMESMEA